MTKPAQPQAADCSPDDIPLEISYAEIRAAYDNGDATPLSDVITDIARYRKHWWIAHTHTWLLITDEPTIAKLNRHSDWSNPTLLRPVSDE